jgi:hypothetical protein
MKQVHLSTTHASSVAAIRRSKKGKGTGMSGFGL